MKEIVAPPMAPIVRNEQQRVQELFKRFVVPTYARFELAFTRGSGSYLWDVNGKRYLDLGGGIAVCALGHANPEIASTLAQQAQQLLHVSNLYYHEPQGRLAQAIVQHLAPGKVFFSNSGAEANEGLYKLARRFGHNEGRFEILTTFNSFHGRTLAGMAATGQEKVKKGFGPGVPGFRHVPYGDLKAMEEAISPATAAILIETIQGEGGIRSATPEYLLGLRELCDRKNLLLMLDGVQDGHFRTGRFQAFQRVLEDMIDGAPKAETGQGRAPGEAFLPDAISMAKSLGGGFPIGAFWVRDKHADLLSAGSHATTFGGTPLGCTVALKVFEVIERDRLADNARQVGDALKSGLQRVAEAYPHVIKNVRGCGLMLGLELAPREEIPAFALDDKPASIQFVNRLHKAGVLTVPSGTEVIRLLPPLNLSHAQAEEGRGVIEAVIKTLAY